MGWVEENAARYRALTGGSLRALAELLADRVTVLRAPGAAGLCLHYPDGTCDLWLPDDDRRAQAHEWAHACAHVGWAAELLRADVATWRRQLWIEEAQAWRWADVYLSAED